MSLNSTQLLTLIGSLDEGQLGELKKAVVPDHGEPLDTIWMMFGGALVFFMHAGFSLIEAGSMRKSSVQNILTKNLLVTCIGFMTWYFLGFGFSFGETSGKFIGTTNFAGEGFLNSGKMREWFFQGAFCATSGTIVSGAMAERTKIPGFVIYIVFLTAFIYPCVVHWGWSGSGFLGYDDGSTSIVSGTAFRDFAGSGIVHMVGGFAGLVGAMIVRPRLQRFEEPEQFVPHNVPLVILGTLVLWFGWYGFNGASTLSMKTSADAYNAALVSMNTTLSPAIAGLVVFILRWLVLSPRRFDVCGFCNGILAGLVSITAPCGTVEPWEALIIGVIGGFVYQGASMLLQRLKIDDPIDAFAVHGACGLWGVLAVGFFGNPNTTGGNGAFYGGDQFLIQFVAAIIIVLWVMGLSVPVFLGLKVAGLLRITDDVQMEGVDASEHFPKNGYEVTSVPRKAEEFCKA